jgi:hypothetical protein
MNKNKKTKIYMLILSIMTLVAFVITISGQLKETPKENDPIKLIEEVKVVEGEGVLGRKEDLESFSIKPYDKVQGKISYSGSVKGGYFFEANILINILDENKNIVLRSYTTAKSDWMTAEPVAFDGTLDLSGLDAGSYYLEIHNDNASGLPENDKSILIPIIIN